MFADFVLRFLVVLEPTLRRFMVGDADLRDVTLRLRVPLERGKELRSLAKVNVLILELLVVVLLLGFVVEVRFFVTRALRIPEV